jgi:NAD(P)-dependent dehydrogenase (short-subunit alcohol dehydrogenase family)
MQAHVKAHLHEHVTVLACCAGAGPSNAWAQEFADNEGDFADWDNIFARNAEVNRLLAQCILSRGLSGWGGVGWGGGVGHTAQCN